MGSGAGTGQALAWAIASDVPSTSPGHRTSSGALGETYSMHTYVLNIHVQMTHKTSPEWPHGKAFRGPSGSLHESLSHECLKAYVCILYASPCAPLLVLWPGEVEGTSLAMAQGKASPVPAPEPMFRVSAVLRRYDADVPPTAVGACRRRPAFDNGP